MFYKGESVFLKGQDLRSRVVKQADTYYVAKLFDTLDTPTADYIKEQLKKIKINNTINTSTGTALNPVKVKCGFIFCDFKDIPGDNADIANRYNELIGLNGNESQLNNFIKTESNGKAELVMAAAPLKWVRLPKNNADYVEKLNDLINDLDTKEDIPDDWKILFLAFPKNAVKITFSQMCGDRMVDTNQKINIVFLDPKVYNEEDNDMLWTTIHETMHALGLPDLYTDRSFGWSIMADCRTGWHITGLEKLVLGWHSLDDYYFLKSGIIKADIFEQSSGDDTKKGIIVLPDEIRSDCYYMEIGQEIGRTKAIRDEFNLERKGLLLMNVQLRSGRGQMSPYVAETSDEHTLGGSAKATFIDIKKQNFNSMGIFSNGSEYKKSIDNNGGKINCTVGVNPSYKVPDSATYLREGEWIATSDNKLQFKLDIRGKLEFGLDIRGKLEFGCDYGGSDPNSTITMCLEYGYYAYVDDFGNFVVQSGSGTSVNSGKELAKFDKYVPKLPKGKYFIKVEDSKEHPKCVAVYSGTPGKKDEKYQYTLFRLTDKIEKGWTPIAEL